MDEAPPPPPRRSFPLPRQRPWLTQVILVFNALLFALLTIASVALTEQNIMEAAWGGAATEVLYLFGAKANFAILRGEYWRLLTPIFLHIGLIHLAFNEYALLLFGRELETLYGTPRFALIYLVSGLFGSIASFAFNPSFSAGASGAIFGIIGAMVAFFARNREVFGDHGREQLRSLLMLIGLNLFLGLSIPGIDNWGHMGGLVAGLVLGVLLAPGYDFQQLPTPPWGRVVATPSLLGPWLALLLSAAAVVGATVLAMGIAPVLP